MGRPKHPEDQIETTEIPLGGPGRADLSGEIEMPPTDHQCDTVESPKVATGLWTELEPGDVLGTYRIVERLPEGGMALLYAARHLRLQREAALKVLKPEYASRAREVRRFLEEARAIGELRHPGIVEVYDFIEDIGREPPLIYIVMELLRGETLSARISRGPLHPAEVVALGGQVAAALEAVHEASLLHRDLKASNIFLVKGEQLQVRLLDFGLTLPFGARQKLNLTDPGTTLGTPEYMSPEQILDQEMDVRSDVYMLGVVLYEMLTGTRPFTGSRVGELLVRQVKELPQPPSQRRPDVPPALEQIVLRCLEKAPERRFQTVAEVRNALELCPSLSVGETQPVTTLRVPRGAPGPTHRGRTLLISVFLLLAAVGMFLGLYLFTGDHKARRREPTARPMVVPRPPDAAAPAQVLRAPDMAMPTPDARAVVPDRHRRRPRVRPRGKGRRPRTKRNKGLKSNPVAPTIDPWKLK